MKCLRCGYCCINYEVVILRDPDAGMQEDNVYHKRTGERCPHLRGEEVGKFSCAIHDHPLYSQTPCAEFGQIEESPDSPCRMGEGLIRQGVTQIIPIQLAKGL